MGNDDAGSTDENASELASLKAQRTAMKRNITNMKTKVEKDDKPYSVKTKVEKDGDTLDETILECRLQILESYFKQISHIQSQIEKLNPADTSRPDIEELFILAKAGILKRLNKFRRTSNMDQSFLNTTAQSVSHHSRLPQIQLPKFDGKYSEYSRFISTYKTLVHEDASIPTIDKFNYLLNCLSGQALTVVEAFPVTENNYQKAIDRLNERYNNKSLMFIDTINSLFAIGTITKPSAEGLRSILDNVAAIKASLLSIGTEKDVLNALIVHIVLEKIDSESKTVYNERQDLESLPSWDNCYQILSRRCQFLETSAKGYLSTNNGDHKTRQKDKRPGSVLVASTICCEYCHGKDHSIGNCKSYLSLPIPRRFEFVKLKSLCINCLRRGHRIAKCSSKSRCRDCHKSHHSSLHNPLSLNSAASNSSSQPTQYSLSSNAQTFTPSSSQPSFSQPSTSKSVQQASSTPIAHNASSFHLTTPVSLVMRKYRHTILPTAVVLIRDRVGTLQPVRALLDSCSEINLITQETVDRLRLPKTKSVQEIAGVSEIRTKINHSVTATIKSRISDFEWTSNFLVIKTISSQQPGEQICIKNWSLPEEIELADPHFFVPQRVDVLIGSEVFFELLLDGKIILGPGLPKLRNTSFGWVVGGVVNSEQISQVSSCNLITKFDELDSFLKRFWEVEEFARSELKMTKEEQECETHFVANTIFNENNRVKVRLPFKQPLGNLGASFETAQRRFNYLEKRLGSNDELKAMYVDFMREYIELGHMSKVTVENLNEAHYVIPHHAVLRPQSTSTKLRVVFDASSRTSTNISLNDTLMVGPTIQQDLIITMLSFRLNKFALSADICKMYRQFLVDERDRNFQLILWRSKVTDPIDVYQLNTVTYGTAAAPFLAIRSLFFIADHYKEEFPIGAEVLTQDAYVDDILTGAETICDLSRKKEQLVNILKSAGLSLSKWNSNYLETADDNEEVILKTNNDNITKTLGMSWKPNPDLFCFRFDLPSFETVTKRSILSTASRIFDILGLLSPIVVTVKILIQELWKQKIEWDTPVPDQIHTRWIQIKESLPLLKEIEIPRFVATSIEYEFEIHGFADASLVAYGCCIYIVACTENNPTSHLLIAKSKVAPVVQQSLPRLELCAAVLLSRTWEKIKHKFLKYNYRIFFWSDSKIVLSWLKKHSSTFVCFVANRVSEIQNITHDISWRYVPSKQNPADVVSRGCLAHELKSTIWFNGPDFLIKGEHEWPDNDQQNAEIPSNEMRKSVLQTTTVINSIVQQVVNRKSSYLRIIHTIVYVHRVFDKSKRKECITAEELNEAFWRIIHDVQQQSYQKEFHSIKNGQYAKPCLQKLSPFTDEVTILHQKYPILRVGGRLANAPLSYDTKFPALLPKDHRFTKLFVEHLHVKHYHAGPKCLIGILRQKVWVVNARELVRKVVRNCVHCFKYKPRLQQQIMGDLPADRLNASRPFLVSGVDFCGPFFTSYRIRGKAPYKTYAAIFVCFASKAIHIEVVSDLTTNTFLLSLKRFISRRGIPIRLYCDNATNFVGANTKLKEFRDRHFDKSNIEAVMQYSAVTGFKFVFIPPRSPHFGGLWEAAVKATKTLLVKNMSQANLTLEEFQTILIEVEAILNSRPLVARSDDPNDGEALTPAHMLIGSSLLSLPDEKVQPYTNLTYLKRYQLVTFLKQQFWEQWSRDYILNLQQKSKWYKTAANISLGTLVIVHEDNTPPQQWILARVDKIFPGRDGKVRVVEVKTAKGTLRRAIHKIAPLPID